MEKNLSTETVFKGMTDFEAVTVLLGALVTLDSVGCELYSGMQFHNITSFPWLSVTQYISCIIGIEICILTYSF